MGNSISGKKIGAYRHPGDRPDLPLMGITHSLHPGRERKERGTGPGA